MLSNYSQSEGETTLPSRSLQLKQETVFIPKKLPVWLGRHSPCPQGRGLRRVVQPLAWVPLVCWGRQGPSLHGNSLVGGHPWLWACCQQGPGDLRGLGIVVWAQRQGWGWGTGRFSFLPPSPTTPFILADEPTSPSIDLQAKHVPASAVVSSAMNSAPVLGTSPSSPTFTFALGRHYSKDCSECSPHPSLPSPSLPQSLLGLLPDA